MTDLTEDDEFNLGVVERALPTGSVIASNCQPSESDVVHDHIRLGQHQIVAVAYIGVHLARHVKHAGTTEGGETVGGSLCGGELSACRGPSEMISDCRSDTSGKVLVKGVGEHLLPTAQPWASAAGPSYSGSRHQKPSYRPPWPPRSRSSLCHGAPGSALWRRDERGTTRPHGDAGTLELSANGAPMNAHGADLAQGQALGVQVSCRLNVHGATVTSRSAASGWFGLRRSSR
jgi:hypothetical protein